MRVLTDVAHAWYEETVLTANVWRRRNRWKTAQGKTIVRLWFFFPDRRKRDTHNGLKLLLDALEEAGFTRMTSTRCRGLWILKSTAKIQESK
nr:RusA family crossover junction endodeoxyribonuclease [Paenibacillus thiaminolyticus]